MKPVVSALLLVLAAAVGAAGRPAPAALFPPPEPLDDPFPIRRFRVAEDQLPAAIKSLDGAPVIRLPRADFEAKVRAAARAAARTPPRVVEATYTAALANNDLTGTADLVVENPSGRPAALPLDSLKLAVKSAAWAGDRAAVLGHLGPDFLANPSAWVEKSGRDTLRLKWSLAGTPQGGERRFELRVPPAVSSALTLELPADRTPVLSNDDAMLTGPFPVASDGAKRAWRFRFGGRSRLEFAVRGARTDEPGVAEAQLVAQYMLTPEQLACNFEYDLQPSRGAVGEWFFALDPGLQVTDVVVNNRAGWRVEPGPTPADPRRLRVTLRQPGAGGKVVIAAVAPLPAAALPAIRPVAAVVQEEKLEIRVHSELKLADWVPGDYRLTNTLAADPFRVLLLVGTLLPAEHDAAFRRMPSLRVADAAAQFTTSEEVAWKLEESRSILTAKVVVKVARGPLFQLAVRTPPGFALGRTDTTPSDLVKYAGPVPQGFVFEFARPLLAGQEAELRVELSAPLTAARVPFPHFAPLGAWQREGVLGVQPGAMWTATAHTDPPAAESPGDALATYPYRGHEPAGWLELKPQSPPSKPPAPAPRAVTESPASENGEAAPVALSELYHVTVVGERNAATVVFGGRMNGGRDLTISLPRGAVVRAACVGARWLDPGRCRTAEENGRPVLKLPASPEPSRFEVRFRVPAGRVVRSELPELPGGPHDVRRWWVFDENALPAWPVRQHQAVDAADLPNFLGGPIDRVSAGWLVDRFDGDAVTILPRRVARAAGFGIAAAVALVAWVGVWRRSVLVFLVAAAFASGAAAVVGPVGWSIVAAPVVLTAIVALGAVVAARDWPVTLSRASARGSKVRAAATGAVALLVFGTAVAQAPAPATVFIVNGTNGEAVVAPRALLERLDATARHLSPGVVVTSAEYDGRVTDSGVSFAARFVVQSLQDGEAVVSLPLADVRLEAATVNGTAAHPVAVRPDLYAVAVRGRGRHEVEVRFAASLAGSGPEREVRFGVPEMPASRVTFAAPPAARQVQAVGRAGAQFVNSRTEAVHLDADLGSTKSVHVRWRQGAAGAAVVKVREGSVWDVAEAAHSLTACYQVRIEQGSVTGLRLEIPAELELTRVAVRPLDSDTGTGVLRDWTLGPERDGFRTLRLNMTGPTDGRLLVILECSPVKAASRQPRLRFPRFHPNGAALEVDSVFGLRTSRVAIDEVDRKGVIDFAADTLTRDFAAVPDLRLEPGAVARAFRPVADEVPELTPVLRAGPDSPTATAETTWRVGTTRADGTGVVRWAGKDAPPLVEFALPGVRALEVRGADVGAWSQGGGRVQVWLRKPAKTADIEWVGTLAPPAKPNEPFTFEPPTPRLPDGRVTADVLRVQPPNGWRTKVERDRGWTASPDGTYTSDGGAAAMWFQFTPR